MFKYTVRHEKRSLDERARIDSTLCSNGTYNMVLISTGLENLSLQEPNPEIGITNDYKPGSIVNQHFL